MPLLILNTRKKSVGVSSTNWNPLDKYSMNLSNNNLTATSIVSGYAGVRSIFSTVSGKYYWEIKRIGGNHISAGINTINASLNTYSGNTIEAWCYRGKRLDIERSYISTWSQDGVSVGDTIGIALDADAKNLWFSVNGVWQANGNPETGLNPAVSNLKSGPYYACVYDIQSNYNTVIEANFGVTPFSFAVPSGFLPGFGEI
jgi:hypothetical protein